MIDKSSQKIKSVHGEDRVELWKELPLSAPMAIFFEPSTYCNFNCCYCTHSLTKERFETEVRKYSNMSLEVFTKAAEQIKAFDEKVKLIEFSGVGEPLFNEALPEMIRLIKDSDVCNHIRLITNAALMSKDKADSILTAGVDSIRVSLQGITSEQYKRISNVNIDFDKIFENIKYLYENKEKTQIFIKNIDIALSEEEHELFFAKFDSVSDRMVVENIIPFFSKVDYDKIIKTKDINRYGSPKKEVIVCPNTFTALVVNSEGDISMCGKEVAPIYLGNVMTTTLYEAWHGKTRRDFLRMHLENRRFDNKICCDCKIPSESLASDKDILDLHAKMLLDKF